jgi:hypothetical protein
VPHGVGFDDRRPNIPVPRKLPPHETPHTMTWSIPTES